METFAEEFFLTNIFTAGKTILKGVLEELGKKIVSGKDNYTEKELIAIIKQYNSGYQEHVIELFEENKFLFKLLISIVSQQNSPIQVKRVNEIYHMETICTQSQLYDEIQHMVDIQMGEVLDVQMDKCTNRTYYLLEDEMWPILPNKKEVIYNDVRRKIENES